MGSRALLNLTPEIQQKTRLESSSVKSSMLTEWKMFGVKKAVILIVQFSIIGIASL